jgi:hypothetical protein
MMQPAPRRRWTDDEDVRLRAAVETHGAARWSDIEHAFGGGRSAAMCRERWHYHLRPDLRKRDWLPEEDALIRAAMLRQGRWAAAVSKQLRGRSAHAVRNRCALLCNHAARSREEGACPPLGDSHGKARTGAQPANAPDPARAQPERTTLHMPHGGGTFFGGGSFGFVRPPTHGAAPPAARLLQPANAHVGQWWGTVPIVQQAMPVIAPMFPRAPSFPPFESFESKTTRTMMPLSFIPPPPLPAWLALGPAATTADTEGKPPFMAAAAFGLDAALEGNSDDWIAAIDAAILELGQNVLGAVA